MTRRPSGPTLAGLALVAISAVVYWLCARDFDAGRGDFFYLADAFLHGRTWLQYPLGPYDIIPIDGRFYVPFAPFPAVALLPIVAILGPVGADMAQSGINALLAAASVGMAWWLLGRLGVRRLMDRLWLCLLFGFSTQILSITTRGGVWHTGQLVATILTLGCLIELSGRRRALLVGLLAGAAFLSRAPLAFAIPVYALWLIDDWRDLPWRRWVGLTVGVLPSIVGFFGYNLVRFGNPLESGYALALLPPFLEELRSQGLFSVSHIGMNLDYLFLHLPTFGPPAPYVHPDALGMSVFVTSPGLLYATLAGWRDRRARLLLLATILVLIPTLLYYGGGWFQYGYRYFLDSVPFVLALCGLAAARRRGIGWGWRALILFGMAVMAFGVYWAYNPT